MVLTWAAVLMLVIRAAVAITEGRVRASGWPLWRCGSAAVALVLHDVIVGWALLAGLGGAAYALLLPFDLGDAWTTIAEVAACGAAVLASSAVLRRRHGLNARAMAGRGRRVAEPCQTARARLLGSIELAGVRGAARWIDVRLESCLRRSGGTADQVLPALWPAVRLRLREVPGTPRTEVALLLLQAQAVMEDASPARERMLTLLHLVYERAGRPGVRGAVEQARRAPVRHGRPGPATTWGSAPVAVPSPVRARTPAL